MHHSSKPRICIYPTSEVSNLNVATFTSEVFDATFSVVFRETVTGAIALHTFAEMLRKQYGHAVEITIADGLALPEDSPVRDMLSRFDPPLFMHGNS